MITLVIVIITCIVSFIGFSNPRLIDALIFNPQAVYNRNEWYRFFTCGFIHADMMHLAFNMFSFYVFGKMVEPTFTQIFGNTGPFLYAILYISSLAVCLIPTYMKHRENFGYRSLGASGAVSAIIFAGIILYPTAPLGLIFIPVTFPAFVFGPLYLFVTIYLNKKGGGNINHSAHFWGAVFGMAFLVVTALALSKFNPITYFIDQVSNY